jgi:TRAP-type C4-dicarboxylate transport system permease small subunit
MVWRVFDGLLDGFAALAAGLLGLMFVAIVYDVVTRNLGVMTVTWVVAITEYGLLYVTALGAPWLLRERGHVSMEALRSALPSGLNAATEKLVLLLCLIACAVAAVAAVPVILQALPMIDMRARFIPRWLMFVPVMVCFALCAVQCVRFLVTGVSMFKGAEAQQDGI